MSGYDNYKFTKIKRKILFLAETLHPKHKHWNGCGTCC